MLHVSKDNRNDSGLCLQDIYKLIGSSQLLIGNSKQKWSILVIPIFLLIAMLGLLILLDTISILLRYTMKRTGKCRRIMLLNTNTLPVSSLCLLLVICKISINPLLSFKIKILYYVFRMEILQR